MSYHHANRLRDHLDPFLTCGEFKGTFGGKERRLKLSPATQLIAWQISSSLNDQTNAWRLSVATLQKRTGLTSQTIRDSIERLLLEKILVRSRSGMRQAYSYRLALQCPPECESRDVHNTKSELQKLDSGQETEPANPQEAESPNEQLTSVLTISKPIENNKSTNKQLARGCFTCGSFQELLDGRPQTIHADNCRKLAELQQTKRWEISGAVIIEWDSLSPTERQRAHHLRMAKVWAMQEAEKMKLDGERASKEGRFECLLLDRQISPRLREWLWFRYQAKPEGISNFIEKAEKRSILGFDLATSFSTNTGAWPQSENDWV